MRERKLGSVGKGRKMEDMAYIVRKRELQGHLGKSESKPEGTADPGTTT